MSATIKHFGVFFDKYYWQTAVLIAKNGLARQYRNSFLGILWTLLQPLVMVLVYIAIIPLIMHFPRSDYILYIVVSLPIWNFFSATLIGASQSILANGETLKRCMISSTVFPIADVLRNSYTLCISFLTIYAVALLTVAPLSPLIILLPVYFIPILMIVGSLSIAIAFIAPYIRDIGELVTVAMNMLFWLTPIIYQPSALPARAMVWMRFNPFYIMIHPIQLLAYDHQLPGWEDIFPLLILTIISILLGFMIFRHCRRNYVYYL